MSTAHDEHFNYWQRTDGWTDAVIIVQDCSKDPRIVQYSHSDYSAHPRDVHYSADLRAVQF